MATQFTCPICGEPTRVYMGNARKDHLCAKHADELKTGKIEQCPDCGKWNKINTICNCKTTQPEQPDELTCIICGKPSNGKHFCIKCYHLYKNKVLYIQVKNCNEFTKLAAEYESDFVCNDGHLAKSPYERIIDDWLYAENIKHAYEKKIDIDKDRDLTPDFYIPEYKEKKDIYIEFWGYDETNIKYQKRKEYATKIYPELVKRDNITVIYLNKQEVINNTFQKKIKYAEEGKINE